MTAEFTETVARSSVLPGLSASIEASELFLFCRDLRGTVTVAAVAATGRALSAHPEIGRALRAAGTGVGVAVDTADGVIVPVVRNATDAPLPLVCAEVTRVVGSARSGRLSSADVGSAVVTVSDAAQTTNSMDIGVPTGCVLAVNRPEYGFLDLTLSPTVDGSQVDGDEWGRFFATLVRLLRHPYRLLV